MATEKNVTPEMVLACPMAQNDAEAATVRDYLKALLRGVWNEGEGFNGKRPFGNSSWEYEVFSALAKGKLISRADSTRRGYALVNEAIDSL